MISRPNLSLLSAAARVAANTLSVRAFSSRAAHCRTRVSWSTTALSRQSVRHMNLHEYQAMELFKKYQIATPQSQVASSEEQAENAAKAIGGNDFVVKAQVLAGGRGKGTFQNGFKGGVHLASSIKDVKHLANKMLGQRLVTKQTGADGKPVHKILVTERLYNRRELYFAILLDRETQGPVMIASSQGGVDIESVAASNPEAIIKQPIDIFKGPTDAQLRMLAQGIGFEKEDMIQQAVHVMRQLYTLFAKSDCTQVEINPMVETHDGKVLCVDAKLNFDDNASFRQQEIFSQRDESQMDAREVEAEKAGLNYIGLDGNIGCLVNGAGLAMATMDVIKLKGGNPANFLDIGGGANSQQVTEAFNILNSDQNVRAILVNIFGGIMRCDVIALGLINAVTNLGLKKPIVIRLQGTNVEEAKKLIEESGLRMLVADDLEDAATKVVRVSEIMRMADEVALNVSFELPL